MGIQGLAAWIHRNPESYEDYELHGENLVIDGNSLACDIYRSGCNCCFAGDYDQYARLINEFFDQLAKCRVTPLVMLDGGMELKKMKTSLARSARYLQNLPSINPSSKAQFIAPLTMVVFTNVLRERGIKTVRCVFEADFSIAGVAKALNCPVLSTDSDFYIFGTLYIPLFTLERFAVKNSDGRGGYVKRCKLYKIENLGRALPDFNPSVFPLAAVLLGNDYIQGKIFDSFNDSLEVSHAARRLPRPELRRIHAVLEWLRHYDLNEAVSIILSTLAKKHRSKVLKIIESTINNYLVVPFDMLLPLGFEKEFRRQLELRKNELPFKYEGNDVISELKKLWNDERCSDSADTSSSDEGNDNELEEETSEAIDFPVDTENENWDEKIADSWPAWFHRRYSIAEFPNSFVDLMSLRLIPFSVRIEDARYAAISETCIEIVRVIDGLLVAGREGDVPGFSYITRVGSKLARRYIEKPLRAVRSTKFPSLSQLCDTDMTIKKQIFDDTLEIADKSELFEDVPTEWRLYLAAIAYWAKKLVEPRVNLRHMYAILLTMLFGIIDEKIGHHRLPAMFQRRYEKAIAEITSKKKSRRAESAVAPNSLVEAVEAVAEDDCWLAGSFFVSKFRMNEKLFDRPEEFNVTIVHVFEHFQACLRYAMALNSLLGYPYQHPNIPKLYNGTMLYNFYECFAEAASVEAYIGVRMMDSSSLMDIFGLLIVKMKSILEATDFAFDEDAQTHQ